MKTIINKESMRTLNRLSKKYHQRKILETIFDVCLSRVENKLNNTYKKITDALYYEDDSIKISNNITSILKEISGDKFINFNHSYFDKNHYYVKNTLYSILEKTVIKTDKIIKKITVDKDNEYMNNLLKNRIENIIGKDLSDIKSFSITNNDINSLDISDNINKIIKKYCDKKEILNFGKIKDNKYSISLFSNKDTIVIKYFINQQSSCFKFIYKNNNNLIEQEIRRYLKINYNIQSYFSENNLFDDRYPMKYVNNFKYIDDMVDDIINYDVFKNPLYIKNRSNCCNGVDNNVSELEYYKEIEKCIIRPLEDFEKTNIFVNSNIIVEGEPGTGKTTFFKRYLVNKYSYKYNITSFDINSFLKYKQSEYVNKEVNIFEEIEKFYESFKKPTIIYIDEAEHIFKEENRYIITKLKEYLDRLNLLRFPIVICLLLNDSKKICDQSLIRKGRFNHHINIKPEKIPFNVYKHDLYRLKHFKLYDYSKGCKDISIAEYEFLKNYIDICEKYDKLDISKLNIIFELLKFDIV